MMGMGQERPASEVDAYFEQLRLAGDPNTAANDNALIVSGAAGGTISPRGDERAATKSTGSGM